ncbi:MAG: hypothetical protein Q9M08_07415, partial [Mariprofundus sp.]|nr:hypothetical protein [Mariprofundus sp.]
ALVAMQDRKSLAAMDIVAVLTKVAKEQKTQLSALKAENAKLSARQAILEGKLEMLVRATVAGSVAMVESNVYQK